MKKKVSFLSKILFIFNLIAGILLLIGYILPYIEPKLSYISSLSIFTPLLLTINFIFFIYWALKMDKRLRFSLIILLIGITFLGRFVKISGNKIPNPEDITIMTYNVRVFNHYKWHEDDSLHIKIVDFIKKERPNIVALQEFHYKENKSFGFYPYQKMFYKNKKDDIGHAILSEYPIVNSGSLDFPMTGNNGFFADILIQKDTIRVYSLHFESFHLNAEEEAMSLTQESSQRIFRNLGKRFAKQQSQVEIFEKHLKQSDLPKIVCGDFNNTAFSYLYRRIKKSNLNDSFKEQGVGIGKTLNFKYFPFRIDYIFIDEQLKTTSHKVFSDIKYSDHYPVRSSFSQW